MNIIYGILSILLGMMNVIYPGIVWKIRHFFTVEGGEPTKYYLVFARVFGVLLIAAGVLILVLK